jgi:hypothetical protein
MVYSQVFDKPFIFVTGTPRSGTSLVTKIIGAHPDVAMIMENILGNRRRHWQKADFWDNKEQLQIEVFNFYRQFNEPILGNKVCTPDVWLFNDIIDFCSLFHNVKILFIIRDPKAVIVSRHKRENHDVHFNKLAKTKLPLDFTNRTRAFISSWSESISVYERLKTIFTSNVQIVYYDDLVKDFETNARDVFKFLEVKFVPEILDWYKTPHYNASGVKVSDLKYTDTTVFSKQVNLDELPIDFVMNRHEILNFEKFLLRKL